MIDIALLKKHVRADDFSDDDEYLAHLLGAAEDFVVRSTNRSLDELCVDGVLPSPIIHAILLVAGHWYNQREGVSGQSMTEVPYTIQALIKPFRRL